MKSGRSGLVEARIVPTATTQNTVRAFRVELPILYYKRLEQGRFEKLTADNIHNNNLKISWTELAMIVEGISVKNIVKRKRFFTKVE